MILCDICVTTVFAKEKPLCDEMQNLSINQQMRLKSVVCCFPWPRISALTHRSVHAEHKTRKNRSRSFLTGRRVCEPCAGNRNPLLSAGVGGGLTASSIVAGLIVWRLIAYLSDPSGPGLNPYATRCRAHFAGFCLCQGPGS